jgi:hypothetical protein
MQQKTHHPAQFEITEQARDSLTKWIARSALRSDDFLFPGRCLSNHLSLRAHGFEIEPMTHLGDLARCEVLFIDYDDWVAAYLYDHGVICGEPTWSGRRPQLGSRFNT